MRKITAAAAAFAILSGASVALADGSVKDVNRAEYKTERFSVDLGIGIMRGESNEYVYNPDGSQLSRLIWKFDNNLVLTGGLSWALTPTLAIGARGRTKLSDASTMDDFDFPGDVCGIVGPFCQSHHEDTALKTANTVDVFASYAFVKSAQFQIAGVVGYRWDHFGWDARGGTSNYAPTFPDVSVIEYDQWWEAPYLGIQASGQWDRFSLKGRLVGSVFAHGHDRDDHKLRDILFTDEFGRDNSMVSASVSMGYDLTSAITLMATVDYDRWFVAKGPTAANDYGPPIAGSAGNVTVYPGDAAGADSRSLTASAGVKVKF